MSMEEAVDICKKRGVVPVGSGSFTAHGTGLDPEDGSGQSVAGLCLWNAGGGSRGRYRYRRGSGVGDLGGS